jgi:RNA polymerase sigma-70 factor, ECF subfamily
LEATVAPFQHPDKQADGPPDARDLIRRAQEGDVPSFEALYRAHGSRVWALCLRMASDPVQAEEWAQEAWIRVWERLPGFREESAFTTWLHRLTVNLILDRRRGDQRRAKRFESVAEYAPFEGSSLAPEAHPGTRMDLERAVATLPDGARTVFLLYDVEGYRHKEIADRLGVAEGTVKAQLHRARKMLREALNR